MSYKTSKLDFSFLFMPLRDSSKSYSFNSKWYFVKSIFLFCFFNSTKLQIDSSIIVTIFQTCPAQVSIKDVSKFGTFINNIKCEGAVELKDGDNITFGTQASSFW